MSSTAARPFADTIKTRAAPGSLARGASSGRRPAGNGRRGYTTKRRRDEGDRDVEAGRREPREHREVGERVLDRGAGRERAHEGDRVGEGERLHRVLESVRERFDRIEHARTG